MTSPRQRLLESFRARADGDPAGTAFTFLGREPRRYTYEELFERAETLGGRLRESGVRRGTPVGLLLRSQESQTLHYLAALTADLVPAVLTPPNRKLNRDYYVETTARVLDRCRFSALVTDVDDLDVDTPRLAPETFELQRPSGDRARDGEPLEVAFLQFSSGTTGIKRGVLVPADAVLRQLEAYAEAIGLSERDVIVSWLPLYHDMGFIACLNMALWGGVHSVMIDPIDWVTNPATFVEAVSEFRGTLAWNPNFAYAFMAQRIRPADAAGVDLASLRGLVNCSEPVTYESQEQFLRRFRPNGLREEVFWGCYAMAETTFALTHGTAADETYLDPVGPRDETVLSGPVQVSVGRALAGVELAVVDPESGERLEDRVVGEIWVRSPFAFDGYYNDAEATAAAHADGWYRTGDLGYLVGDELFVAGRKKDLLIVGGVNVFPQDLEDVTAGVAGVIPGRVSAFSTFDERAQTERVTVLFETELADDELADATIAIRQRILAAFQVANFEVRAVEPGWLVKSTSGKMARSANRAKWLREQAQTTAPLR